MGRTMATRLTSFRLYAVALGGCTLALLAPGLLSAPPCTTLLAMTAILFTGLILLGERTIIPIARVDHNLAAVAHVAAIVLLPPPIPLLVALAAVATTQLPRRLPWDTKLFNLSHTALNVGLVSLSYATLAPTAPSLPPATILAHPAAVVALIIAYIALDNGLLQGALLLLAPSPRRLHLGDVLRDGVLPELASLPFGLVGAVLYQVHPLLLLLLAAPLVIVHGAFRATATQANALRRRGAQLEAVLASAQRLCPRQSAADILAHVAAGARAITGASTAAAYLRDIEEPAMLERLVLDADDADDRAAPGLTRLPQLDVGTEIVEEDGAGGRVALVPIEQAGVGVVGALRLSGVTRTLQADDRDALTILAAHAATALDNAQHHARALAAASEDSLTELLNHRAFQTRLEEEVARARRGGQSLAVVMIDLDGFGRINNAHGHQAGDVTLLAVARCLRAQTRYADIVARYGGDEFAAILPEIDLNEALSLAERIRDELARLTVAHGARAIHVAASIGVAVMPGHATTREDLVGAADRASYAAKRAGGNRVRQATEGAPSRDPVSLAAQLDHANLATVEALAAMVDAKDAYTRGHSGRVSGYAAAIAAALGLPEADIARVRQAGLLHDVGKIGVPDAILLKPGGLSDEEFAVIKQHPAIGERILQGLPFLAEILPAVRHHHERWDGRGYPDGLVGAAIPADAAILAVADSFDAMTSSRTYRVALPVAEAIRRVREGAGAQYDPRLVAAFDRALADGTLAVPSIRTGELRALPPHADVAPLRTPPARVGALRVVG